MKRKEASDGTNEPSRLPQGIVDCSRGLAGRGAYRASAVGPLAVCLGDPGSIHSSTPHAWRLASFMQDAREMLRRRRANVIYGTVRMMERDDETFLVWARDRYACINFNLHVERTPQAIEEAAETFRQLIDLGITHDGSYYLTHRCWARRDQVEACYLQMREFLALKRQLKRQYDLDEVFQSNWYPHYRDMFATR